jgi:hypothetical protein
MVSIYDPKIMIPVSETESPDTYKAPDGSTLHKCGQCHYHIKASDPTSYERHLFRLASDTDIEDHKASLLTKEILMSLKDTHLTSQALFSIRDIINDPKNHIPLKHP